MGDDGAKRVECRMRDASCEIVSILSWPVRFDILDFRKAGESETATPATPETGNTPPAVGG